MSSIVKKTRVEIRKPSCSGTRGRTFKPTLLPGRELGLRTRSTRKEHWPSTALVGGSGWTDWTYMGKPLEASQAVGNRDL